MSTIKCPECHRELQFDIRTGKDRCINEDCDNWGKGLPSQAGERTQSIDTGATRRFTEEETIEAAWLFHVAHAPNDGPKQFREALFEKFERRSMTDALLRSLKEAIYVTDEVHDHGCACIAALVPCDCWLSRAKAAVAEVEGRSYAGGGGPATTSSPKWSIGDVTGTLFKNGDPTGVEFKVFNGSAHTELISDANNLGKK